MSNLIKQPNAIAHSQKTVHFACACGSALGMTATYTHSRQRTRKREIERALRLWPQSLEFARRCARQEP